MDREIHMLEKNRLETRIDEKSKSIVFGVNHDSALNSYKSWPVSLEILSALRDAQDVIVEGTPYSQEFAGRTNPSVEALVWNAARLQGKPIHYLEGDIRFAEVLEKAGVPINVAAMSEVAGKFYVQNFYLQNTFGAYFASRALLAIDDKNPSFSGFNLSEKLDCIMPLIGKTQTDPNYPFWDAAMACSEYFVRLRDAEIICPRAKDLARKLGGKKMFVVGKMHVENITGAIKNGTIPHINSWQKHCEGLPANYLEVYADFERACRN